jgi:prepilin-type N-terminal cleavage/methylation domain-containing protein
VIQHIVLLAHRRRTRVLHSGFTLLEVILTLAISTILIAAVTAAIGTYMRVSEVGRAEVERAQLARTLLRRIADDLRSTVPMPTDAKAATMSDAATALTSTSSGTGGSTTSTNNSSATAAATDAAAETESASSASTSASTASSAVFYGTQYELQFQISRLPPLTASLLNPTTATDPLVISSDSLSDVKRVSYFLQSAASQAGAAVTTFASDGAVPTAAGGLVRQESSQVAAEFADSQGGANAAFPEPPTPEVAALEFRYFDGMEWLYDWDSSITGALPQAVEITLVLRSATTGDPLAALDPLALTSVTGATAALPDDRYYRLVVHLPAAVPNYGALSGTTSDATSTSTETTP